MVPRPGSGQFQLTGVHASESLGEKASTSIQRLGGRGAQLPASCCVPFESLKCMPCIQAGSEKLEMQISGRSMAELKKLLTICDLDVGGPEFSLCNFLLTALTNRAVIVIRRQEGRLGGATDGISCRTQVVRQEEPRRQSPRKKGKAGTQEGAIGPAVYCASDLIWIISALLL